MSWSIEELYELARLQAAVWTIADAVCVGLVLLILDRIRERVAGGGRAKIRWAMLGLSLLAYPWVLLAGDRSEFFRREVVVVSLHLGALLLSLRDLPATLRFLKLLEERRNQAPR